MAEFSENRHISNLINMSCKVVGKRKPLNLAKNNRARFDSLTENSDESCSDQTLSRAPRGAASTRGAFRVVRRAHPPTIFKFKFAPNERV